MAKNIVLLSDGTGNSAAKLFKTNVWRLYQALDLRQPDQIALYDDGVGTETFKPVALLGGAVGYGLKRNVLELYTFLCRNYRPDDRIYAFGFSRGAFTIRTLIGLIDSQGIVHADNEPDLRRYVRHAFRRDRQDFRTKLGRERLVPRLRPMPAAPPVWPAASITFVGLWDTVDAYGMPIDELKRGVDHYFRALSFPDQRLSKGVERACHALALNDERLTFHPVLFDEKGSERPERIKQVWFAGAHSNVGGGYPNDALAHVSLGWMMAEATRAGLRVLPDALQQVKAVADPHGELHDSRSGLAAYYRYSPRKLSALCDDAAADVHIARPKIHESVLARVREGRVPYAPINLPPEYDVVGSDGTVVAMSSLPAETHLGEGAVEAARRAGTEAEPGEQEQAWDLVWWRRLLYFVTVVVTGFLAAFPWLFPVETRGACRGRWCFVDPLLGVVGSFTPGGLAGWIDAFRQTPGWFLVGAAALAVSLTVSRRLAGKINDAGETAWRHLKRAGIPPSPRYRPGVVYRIRTARILLVPYHWVTRELVPLLFAIALVVGGLVLTNRVVFEIGSSFGFACTGSATVSTIGAVPVSVEFATSDPCKATGYVLERGRRYEITIRRTAAWIDGSIPVADPLRGFTAWEATRLRGTWTGVTMYAAAPLKRTFGQNWFRPVARIRPDGRDQYVLGSSTDDTYRVRTTGELFLFVNDAVLGLPDVGPLAGAWSAFYAKNEGRAVVTIRRIERR